MRYRSATTVVPVGTTVAVITLRFVRYSGSDNDGLADNLSLVLNSPASATKTTTTTAQATNTPGPPIRVGSYPDVVAITANGETAYVVNDGSGTVTPISTATNTPGPAIRVGLGPVAIAITPNGETAYVPSSESRSVTPIDI
jgi:YVTN family beta-propeller protein